MPKTAVLRVLLVFCYLISPLRGKYQKHLQLQCLPTKEVSKLEIWICHLPRDPSGVVSQTKSNQLEQLGRKDITNGKETVDRILIPNIKSKSCIKSALPKAGGFSNEGKFMRDAEYKQQVMCEGVKTSYPRTLEDSDSEESGSFGEKLKQIERKGWGTIKLQDGWKQAEWDVICKDWGSHAGGYS